MTKQDALTLYKALNSMGRLTGVKFAYAVSKNINILQSEIDVLNKSIEASPEFQEIDKKRVVLAEEHAKKNDKGKPIKVRLEGVEQYDMEDNAKWDKEFAKFKLEHKAEYEARDKQLFEYANLLETETDVKLFKVSISDVPEAISVQQMHAISAIVDEATPSPYGAKAN